MSSSNLVGKSASFFLDGGWQISGLVVGQESDKIILDKDGELFLLFKEKVSFVKIEGQDPKKKVERNISQEIMSNRQEEDEEEFEEAFPENGISYSETFLNIPRSLLGPKSSKDVDDFSISFRESSTNNSLTFKVEDDS
jgi:sRNA-binding regulator protein Hfq